MLQQILDDAVVSLTCPICHRFPEYDVRFGPNGTQYTATVCCGHTRLYVDPHWYERSRNLVAAELEQREQRTLDEQRRIRRRRKVLYGLAGLLAAGSAATVVAFLT